MSKYIDMELAMEYLGGLKQIHEKVAISFLKNYEYFENEIIKQKDANLIDDLYIQIHSLKGFCLNLGAKELNDIANRILLDLGRNMFNKKDVDEFLRVFHMVYEELKIMYQ